jgi:tetratricopeptide (TPR) repeat protein
MKRTMLLVAWLGCAVARGAAVSESEFENANRLYAQNQFPAAAAAYEQIARSNGVSAALLFNLGNAQFKAGHRGEAIAAYRRAAQLAPRDADLRANLQFVRSQVSGVTVRPNWFERSSGLLSVNEWTVLTAAGFWLTLGLLTLGRLRPMWTAAIRTPVRLLAILTLLAGGAFAYSAHQRAGGRTIVVTVPEASARITPNAEARPAFTANDGAELRVLDAKDDWLQVSDGTPRRFGWIQRQQTVSVP